MKGSWKKFPWVPHLWVGRLLEPILVYVSKIDKKKGLIKKVKYLKGKNYMAYDQGCGVGVGVGVARSRRFWLESESELEFKTAVESESEKNARLRKKYKNIGENAV